MCRHTDNRSLTFNNFPPEYDDERPLRLACMMTPCGDCPLVAKLTTVPTANARDHAEQMLSAVPWLQSYTHFLLAEVYRNELVYCY